jgi:hypothetical protein
LTKGLIIENSLVSDVLIHQQDSFPIDRYHETLYELPQDNGNGVNAIGLRDGLAMEILGARWAIRRDGVFMDETVECWMLIPQRRQRVPLEGMTLKHRGRVPGHPMIGIGTTLGLQIAFRQISSQMGQALSLSQQGFLNPVSNGLVHRIGVSKADLGLTGMHVDIHLLGIHFQEENDGRIGVGRD